MNYYSYIGTVSLPLPFPIRLQIRDNELPAKNRSTIRRWSRNLDAYSAFPPISRTEIDPRRSRTQLRIVLFNIYFVFAHRSPICGRSVTWYTAHVSPRPNKRRWLLPRLFLHRRDTTRFEDSTATLADFQTFRESIVSDRGTVTQVCLYSFKFESNSFAASGFTRIQSRHQKREMKKENKVKKPCI